MENDEITELKYIINYVWNHSSIGLFKKYILIHIYQKE